MVKSLITYFANFILVFGSINILVVLSLALFDWILFLSEYFSTMTITKIAILLYVVAITFFITITISSKEK